MPKWMEQVARRTGDRSFDRATPKQEPFLTREFEAEPDYPLYPRDYASVERPRRRSYGAPTWARQAAGRKGADVR